MPKGVGGVGVLVGVATHITGRKRYKGSCNFGYMFPSDSSIMPPLQVNLVDGPSETRSRVGGFLLRDINQKTSYGLKVS